MLNVDSGQLPSQAIGACPVTLAYIAPLAQLKLPPQLDGSQDEAARVARKCHLSAKNDLQAVGEWLNGFESAKTRYAYRIQIEKALTWSVAQRHKPLSTLSVQDTAAFLAFLRDPVPHEVWLPSRTSKATKRWTPFRKVASRRSSDYTLAILALLFEHWFDEGYVATNPCRKRVRSIGSDPRQSSEKVYAPREAMLTAVEWAYLWKAAQSQYSNEASSILAFAYFAGLLPNEIAAIQISAFSRIELESEEDSIWSVTIGTRPLQRQEVFLLPVVVQLVGPFFPRDSNEFKSFTAEKGEVYLMDLINQSGYRRRGSTTRGPTASSLSSKIGCALADAVSLAEAAGDDLAAVRLKEASLSWVSLAFEQHLDQGGIANVNVWRVIAAMRLVPAIMREYLPNRTRVDPMVIWQALNKLQSFYESQV